MTRLFDCLAGGRLRGDLFEGLWVFGRGSLSNAAGGVAGVVHLTELQERQYDGPCGFLKKKTAVKG